MKSARSFLFVVIMVLVLKPAALSAAIGTNEFDPGVPLSITETNAIRSAASSNLALFRNYITPANRQLMGFDTPGKVSTSSNGGPLLIFTVQMKPLTNYHAGIELDSLLEKPPQTQVSARAFVPIMDGTNAVSSTVLSRRRGPAGTPATWGGKDWGHPKVIRNLIATIRAIPAAEIRRDTVPFAVELPMPRIWLVGYYDTKQQLVLRSTIKLELGPITINHHEVVTQAGMEKIADEARRYNPALPN
jgi:hypothetical protein